MMRRTDLVTVPGVLAVLALFAGCSLVSTTASVPARHPEEVAALRVDCLECHQGISGGALKPYGSFSHSRAFVARHGLYALQSQNLCASCHESAFCQACHPRKDELKPSIRYGDRPDRMLPHRGDYIVLHRIDGRLDPGSCFTCHGNKDNGKCRACHR
jgi:hypothetical protein